MRGPHIDAAALLAAHGHSAAPITFRKGLRMADTVRFALLPRLDATVKPVVFPDIHALARKIQRERGLQALDMTEIEDLELAGRPDAHRGVQIYTLDDGNNRDRFLGYAWLDGGGLETLKSALRRNPVVMPDAEAA
ncbi:MAG: hypothetical protein EON91_02560 [Brevundimonas sp.]|uniref:hypothetical protein n=1 Tax=Brevundimonas sp. TaxID=1871086 RepID=UPI0011F63A10|nr:hypothetical protein [Brevundimonas sp.]RZJ19095.1 MAG: hypothetical protein EON91_02560 [Brevundimonas sp.]